MRVAVAVVIVLGCSTPKRAAGPTGVPATPTAPDASPAVPQPKTSTDVAVTIRGNEVLLNGKRLGGKPMIADVIAALGKPDRRWDASAAANRIHTWDKLGVLAYEPYDGRCISLTLPFRPMALDFDPKTLFAGKVVLDGKPLAPATRVAAVKKWPGATTPYAPTSVVFARGDIQVFTVEEKDGSGLDLVEIGFWQTSKGEAPEESATAGVSKMLELDCKAGDARMCTRLALVFQTGADGDKNFERAFTFAKLACDAGDAFGCTMLGNMHDAGRGTPKSAPAARTAWKRACTLGDAVGCERSR